MVISIDCHKGVVCACWFLSITGNMIMSNGAAKAIEFPKIIKTVVSTLGASLSV